jgi:hypothetical protein
VKRSPEEYKGCVSLAVSRLSRVSRFQGLCMHLIRLCMHSIWKTSLLQCVSKSPFSKFDYFKY